MERKPRNSFGEKRSFKKDGDGEGRGRRAPMRAPRMTIPSGMEIDYKNISFLQKCLTERGKVLSRRLTGADAKQQRMITVAVKRARFLGLLTVGSSRKKG